MVQDIYAADPIDVKKTLEETISFAKLHHIAQADQFVWHVIQTDTRIADEKKAQAFFLHRVHG